MTKSKQRTENTSNFNASMHILKLIAPLKSTALIQEVRALLNVILHSLDPQSL